jgi:hypothetical protein
MADWSLTSLQLKLIKIGARVVRHARAITFQLAEVAVAGQKRGGFAAGSAQFQQPARPQRPPGAKNACPEYLSSGQIQAISTSVRRPLGECRFSVICFRSGKDRYSQMPHMNTPLAASLTAFFTVTLLATATPSGAKTKAVPPVSIDLQMDANTVATLEKRGEKVVVRGWYYGFPVAGSTVQLDDMGLVYLGNEELTIWPAARTSLALGGNLASAPIQDVQQPMINVNVFTARHTDENNLITCKLVEGAMADLAATPQVITCSLIEG